MSKPAPHVCARCPRSLGRSCCEVAQDEKLATLTHADVSRIQQARGGAAPRFVEEEVLELEVAVEYERRRPLYAGYFQGGPVRLTLARRGGACVFHDRERGCTLSTEERPTACLLYPFEPSPGDELTLLVDRHGSLDGAAADGGCLAVEEAESLEGLMAAFGATRASLAVLGQRLRQEVQAHGRVRPGNGNPTADVPGRRRRLRPGA